MTKSELDAVNARVRVEFGRFLEVLPRLKEQYFEKWVVFLDDEVRFVGDDEETAYDWAIDTFGMYGGQVVAQVVDPRPVHIASAALFARRG